MMISFPLQATCATQISLNTLTSLAPLVAELITEEQPEAIKLILGSYGIPGSEHPRATRQLAIGWSLDNAFGGLGEGMFDPSIEHKYLDPEIVEWIVGELLDKAEGSKRDGLKIWPANPFAGIFFAASGVCALISVALFAAGHPVLGVLGAAGTTAGVLWSLNLNGNFK